MHRLSLLVAVACGSAPPPTSTPPPPPPTAPPSDLDVALERARGELDVPALALAVWRDGVLLETGAVGVRKRGAAAKVTTADRWHLGSNTKAMTALVIGVFVDRGALRWSDTIATLFPDERIDPGYAGVTLDQLIHHEGGTPAEPPLPLWTQLALDGDAPDARIKFVRAILATPPAVAPGTFAYSNTGYMIAGAALERVTGKRWEDVMRTELFDKLGMTSCGFGAPTGEQPRGHDASGAAIEPGPHADNLPGLGPAGTVYCSLADYGKFLDVFATAKTTLVTPATLAHLQTPTAQYAGGWLSVVGRKGRVLMHSGSNTLWYATALVLPAKRLAFVVATNQGKNIETGLQPLLERYLPKE